MNKAIVTTTNEAYVCWTKLLLKSLVTHDNSNASYIVFGLALSASSQEELSEISKKVIHIPVTLKKTTGTEATDIANNRPLWLLDLLQNTEIESLFMLDADLIVRNNINYLFTNLNHYGLALVIRNGCHNGKEYMRLKSAAGLVGISKTNIEFLKQCIQFMNEESPIEDVKPWAWFWEQINLYRAYLLYKEKVFIIPQKKFLNSPPFDSKADIWSANVKEIEKRATYQVFKDEMERTRNV